MKPIYYPLLLSSTLLLVACDSDSNSSGSANRAVIGTVDTVSASQITVSGNAYATDTLTVEYAGIQLPATELPAGMGVALQVRDERAKRIFANPDLAGNITAVAGNTITVDGTDVALPAADPALLVGDYVLLTTSASGGGVQADAVIELPYSSISLPLYYELEGSVSAFDNVAKTFVLDTVDVDFSSAVVDADHGALGNGALVEVLGQYDATGVLVARKVETESRLDGTREILGEITWVAADQGAFVVSHVESIQLAATTRFEDGRQAALLPGRLVQVTVRESDGVVLEVDFERDLDIGSGTAQLTPRFEVSGVAAQNGITLSLNGFDFVLTATTRYEDGLNSSSDFNGLNVEIEGIETGGQYQITEIGREDINETDMDIRGPAVVTGGATSLWGYSLSLAAGVLIADGQWVDLECDINGANLTNCRFDY